MLFYLLVTFLASFGQEQPVQELFTFLSSNVQGGCTSPLFTLDSFIHLWFVNYIGILQTSEGVNVFQELLTLLTDYYRLIYVCNNFHVKKNSCSDFREMFGNCFKILWFLSITIKGN